MKELKTFTVPALVTGTQAQRDLGRDMIDAWRSDGIFQIATSPPQQELTAQAFDASRRFFGMPLASKARCISDLSYSGYIASGEEITAGQADFSEIFTVCPDIPADDPRVRAQWPCHGPVPWPDEEFHQSMSCFMGELGSLGERLLKLVALGLKLFDLDALTRLTQGAEGWHHMRVLRFPTASRTTERGIGAHTDYGLLVIAAQDQVGGLWIRPPVEGEERKRNWLEGESSAGMYEHEEPWHFVRPVPNVLTVFPGDILQFLTGGHLLSTPHKVRLADRERFALAYFHEPTFVSTARPLFDPSSTDEIHYGTHFTNMFMRCYPERVTTRRILAEDRLAHLPGLRTRRAA
jgi:isopenicillin N synthase-like dioxygenase